MAYDYQGISLKLATNNASETEVPEALLVFGNSFGKEEFVGFI